MLSGVSTYRDAEEAAIEYDHQSDESFKVDMLSDIVNKRAESVAFRAWRQM